MTKQLAVIIPIYRESSQDLDHLKEWVDKQRTSSISWLLTVANDQESHAALLQSKFNSQNSIPEDMEIDKKIELDNDLYLLFCQRGRGKQMNIGANNTDAPTLVFHHCDTRLDEGWIEELSNLKGSSWGCFIPKIEDQGIVFHLAESWGFLRSKYMGLPYGDQSIFVDKSLFQRAGQYDEKTDFMEDLHLAKRLTSLVGKPVIMSTNARTSSRLWRREKNSNLFAVALRSFKNIVAFLAFILGVPRKGIKDWYQK